MLAALGFPEHPSRRFTPLPVRGYVTHQALRRHRFICRNSRGNFGFGPAAAAWPGSGGAPGQGGPGGPGAAGRAGRSRRPRRPGWRRRPRRICRPPRRRSRCRHSPRRSPAPGPCTTRRHRCRRARRAGAGEVPGEGILRLRHRQRPAVQDAHRRSQADEQLGVQRAGARRVDARQRLVAHVRVHVDVHDGVWPWPGGDPDDRSDAAGAVEKPRATRRSR